MVTADLTRDARLHAVIAEYIEAVEAGRAADRGQLLAAHTDLAEALAAFFAGQDQMADLAAPLRAVVSSDGDLALADVPVVGILGDFRILREVGRGGMGVVYEAEQISLSRRVALKVLPYAATMDSKQLQRFRNEAHAAAHLHHQNIVPVYAVGCERGVHYYAMQLIDGQSLAAVIGALRQQAGLPTADATDITASATSGAAGVATGREAGLVTERTVRGVEHCRSCARLGVQAAEALDHAHQMGVVHRDVKPANLMVDARRHLWVTDFGLARFHDDRGLTRTGDILGTMRYMSPEQAHGRPDLVDERTDVYSLGVTLYELLTLEPAFPAGDRQTLVGQIVRDEPKPPRRINPAIPAELETVVLKALAKDTAERYRTAQELADDLRRFLDDRAVLARRPGPVVRLRRWVRRHRPAVATAAVGMVLLLVMAVAGLAVSNAMLTREGNQTRAAQRDQTQQLAITYLKEAEARRSAGFAGRRLESLELVRKATGIFAALGTLDEARRLELRKEAIACLALSDVRLIREWEGHPPGWSGPAFDGDLNLYLRRDQDGMTSVRRVGDDQELQRFFGAAGMLSPGGNHIAVRSPPDRHFLLRDWRHGRDVISTSFPIEAMAFNSDGQHIALGQSDGTISTYDVETGHPEHKPFKAQVTPNCLSYSPDGARLAIGSLVSHQVQVRDTATGEMCETVPAPEGAWSLAWHPDGVLLAVGCNDRNIHIWDTKSHRSHAVLRGHQVGPYVAGFAAGGDILVSWSWDWTTRLWDPWSGRELVRFSGVAAAVSRDGRRLAGEVGRNLALWEILPSREYRTVPKRRVSNREDADLGGFSPDGRWLALGTSAGARFWDWAHGREIELPPMPRTLDVKFHPSGKELFTSGPAGLCRYPVREEADVLRLGPAQRLPVSGSVQQISLDGEGRMLTVANHRGGWLIDLANPAGARLFPHANATHIGISPDAQWVAIGAHHGHGVTVYGATRDDLATPPLIPRDQGARVLFSPDNRWLVTSTTAEFQIRPTGSWELTRSIRREQPLYNQSAAFSADGRVLALTSSLSAVQLRSPAREQVWAELQAPDTGPVSLVGFSPDGGELVVAAYAGDVRVWDLRRIREQLRDLDLDWDLRPYPSASRGSHAPVKKVEFVGYPLGLLPQPYLDQGYQSARRARWADARANYAMALELDPSNHRTWHDASVLFLETAEVERYRRVCRDMLAQFRQDTNPNVAERTAKTCCLAPGAVSDYGPVLLLAKRAVGGQEKNGDYRWFVLARGMVDYRMGNFTSAIDWVRRSLSPGSELPVRDGLAHLFLAMAHHRLGQADEARQSWDRARTMEQRLPKLGADLANWPDWLRFHIVRREAEELLNKGSAVKNQDP